MFVLGTAGHIDHGKSSLVQALTGTNPDRLPEEQARGMTIDLGFAWLRLPGGDEIGLIDVPGHERFVRNMVAGAGGINAAMLVIAADDGWMPQTQEHVDILNLLGIRHGFVALTKIDLVEPDWRELVAADIKARLAGTFLAEAPIVPVSSVTGEGVDDIVGALTELAGKVRLVDDIGKSRLFIDRVFVLTGIGVVITGTSRGGGYSTDADVYHFPSGTSLRIRSLQSHERTVARVGPGYRAAINLTGVDRDRVKRGDVVTGFHYQGTPTCFAAYVTNLPRSGFVLKEGRRVLCILGTTETDAIIRPFDNDGIPPGRSGLAIVKTMLPLAAFVGDNFILRLPTPQVTVGGGLMLDILDAYPRRKDLPPMQEYLKARLAGDLSQIVLTEMGKRLFSPADGFLMYADFSAEEIAREVSRLEVQGEVIRFEGALALQKIIASVQESIAGPLHKTHAQKSYLKGLKADELARQIGRPPDDQFQTALRYLEQAGRLKHSQQFYHLPDFAPALDDAMTREADRIVVEMEQAGHNYLSLEELEARHPGCRRTLNFLRDDGRLVIIGSQYVMTGPTWRAIVEYVGEKLTQDGQVTVAEYRDRFGSSRKYALPVLEHLDRISVTRREGDVRVKGGRFDERHTL